MDKQRNDEQPNLVWNVMSSANLIGKIKSKGQLIGKLSKPASYYEVDNAEGGKTDRRAGRREEGGTGGRRQPGQHGRDRRRPLGEVPRARETPRNGIRSQDRHDG